VKLVRFGPFREEKPGLMLDDGSIRDLSREFEDWGPPFFASGGLADLQALSPAQLARFPRVAEPVRLGAPFARPHKVICVGLNYADHARESGLDAPNEPVLFMKGSNTVVGPEDQVIIPKHSRSTDWEVELGVLIGKTARYLDSESDTPSHIAGYCVSNDVSEREFQLHRGGQWVKGKSCDNFNPTGPWLLTPGSVDVSDLGMRLWVNGELRQNSRTAQMIFKVPFLVWYISQFMTLEPGDFISTGTPAGVGLGMKPPRYLVAGDVIELEIEGLGRQRQVCVNA
jgi:2,4-didehydro-3-deoxy-L-rhamnonate hydrolase